MAASSSLRCSGLRTGGSPWLVASGLFHRSSLLRVSGDSTKRSFWSLLDRRRISLAKHKRLQAYGTPGFRVRSLLPSTGPSNIRSVCQPPLEPLAVWMPTGLRCCTSAACFSCMRGTSVHTYREVHLWGAACTSSRHAQYGWVPSVASSPTHQDNTTYPTHNPRAHSSEHACWLSPSSCRFFQAPR